MSVEIETKAVLSVAGMARMVGLSRARFYQLVGSAFPPPLYDIATRRPFYSEELQKTCLEVRRRNCGIDGSPILFYSRGNGFVKRPRKPEKHADLVDALKSLGLFVKASQVSQAVQELFPNGLDGQDNSEVIRAIFVHLRRQNSADSVHRGCQDSGDSVS